MSLLPGEPGVGGIGAVALGLPSVLPLTSLVLLSPLVIQTSCIQPKEVSTKEQISTHFYHKHNEEIKKKCGYKSLPC